MERGRVMELATIFGAAAVLAYLAVLATVNLYAIDSYGKLEGRGQYETIKVYGGQFSWEFVYPNGTRSFYTLVVRAGEPYRLETSRDVIHSFYIPELGIKYDTVPGFIYVTWLKVDTPSSPTYTMRSTAAPAAT
jgi:cytochrome aa3-600 menaquinol oxidase subunit 2